MVHKTNLKLVPSHKGDTVTNRTKWQLIKLGLRRPYTAVKFIIKKILWGLANISDNIPVESFLGKIPIYVIDVGAAGGISRRWGLFGSNLKIFLFEPEQEAFEKLVSAYGSDERMKIFNYALSEDGKDIILHITKWPRSSSVFPPSKEYAQVNHIRDHYEVVKVVSLSSKRLVDIYDSPDLDFIKIDTEGFELPILKGGSNLLDLCVGLEVEVYFQQVRIGQPFFSDVDSYCRSKGFTFMDFYGVGQSVPHDHFLLPSYRLESRGSTHAAEAALYFRWPQHIIGLVENGKWGFQKIYKAVALYLAFDQAEFAYVLLCLAKEKGMVNPNDSKFIAAMKAVEDYSGFNKSFLYYKLRKLFVNKSY